MKGNRVTPLNLHGLHWAVLTPPTGIRPLRHLDHSADVGGYLAIYQVHSSFTIAAELLVCVADSFMMSPRPSQAECGLSVSVSRMPGSTS